MNALVLALLLATTPLTMEQYVGALEQIDALLASNQLAAAQSEARLLMNHAVSWNGESFQTDTALLGAINAATRAEGPHRARLLFAIDELRRTAGLETGRADPKLLAKIAAEQEVPELPKGGEIKTTVDADLPLLERIVRSIADAWRWLRQLLRRIVRWILDLFPSWNPKSGGTPGMRWLVIALVAAIVLLIVLLAWKVLRRSQAAAPVAAQTSAPIGSTRDEDPLSRGAAEWQRYAATLASSGRFREAIRAWYHAVLVTCYAGGILHFRKGRTNWEYIASLAPTLAWRADLIALTRRFEREWYGHEESAAETHDECRELAQRIIGTLTRELRGAA